MDDAGRKIKVMVLSASLGKGGTERVFSLLLERLDRGRFAPELAVFAPPISYDVPEDVLVSLLSERVAPEFSVHINASDECIARDREGLEWMGATAARLTELVREREPDVILASPLWASIMALIASAGFPPSTRLVNIAGAPPSAWLSEHPQRELFSELIRTRLGRSDAVVAVANGVAEDLTRNFGIEPELITVVHTPANLAAVQELADEPLDDPSFADDVPVVLFVGRLERVKGLEYLLRAVATVIEHTPVRCVLVGEGAQQGYLHALVRHLGIGDSVRFVGRRDNPFSYMVAATVFVLPSLSEGMPNVLLEAMACGCPVIATDIEGGVVREVLEDGRCGVIVPLRDEGALAEAIIGLLGDAESRERYARAGKRRAADFDLPRIVKEFGDLLTAAVQGGPRLSLLPSEDRLVPLQHDQPEAAEARTIDEADGIIPPAPAPSVQGASGAASSDLSARLDSALVRRPFAALRSRISRMRPSRERCAPTSPVRVPEKSTKPRLMMLVPTLAAATDGSLTEILVRYLGARGYDVWLVTVFEAAECAPPLSAGHYPLRAYSGDARLDPVVVAGPQGEHHTRDVEWIAGTAAKAAGIASELGADVILADGYMTARLALIAKRNSALDIPVVVKVHEGPQAILSGAAGDLEATILRDHLGDADGVLAADPQSAVDVAEAFDGLRDRTEVLASERLVDTSAIMARSRDELPEHPWLASDIPFFLCVQEPDDESGILTVLRAAGASAPKAEFRVLVVLDGTTDIEAARALAFAEGVGSGRVDFLLGPEWSNRLLAKAVALVHPVAGPLVGATDAVVRAMAVGCPVISTALSETMLSLIGTAGPALIVRSGDALGLAEAMLQLLWDEEARDTLGSLGPERLRAHSLDGLAERVDTVLKRLCVGRP